TVKFWDASTGEPAPLELKGHKRWVRAVAWSRNGTLASGCEAGEIRLWDAKTGTAGKVFKGHDGPIHALAWVDDGKVLLSLGEQDGTVCLWQTDTEKPPRVSKGLPGKGRFSPDRKLLVSRFDQTRVQIWSFESETGRLRGTLLHLQGQPEQYLAV